MSTSALWIGARAALDSGQALRASAALQEQDVSPFDAGEGGHSRQLRIFTLGHFEVWLPEQARPRPLIWSNAQSQVLFKALLGASGQQMTREQAIEILWPECDPEWGKTRLRQTLSKLRHSLEPTTPAYSRSVYVTSDRTSVRLAIARSGDSTHMWLDVLAFERLAEAAIHRLELGHDGRALADAALALYRGPFLPLDRYAEWSRALRQRYHRLWETLLRRLVYSEVAERQLERAITHLGTLTDSAPDDEDAVCLSMVVYAAVGRRAEALRIYDALRMRLRVALGSAPKPELQALRDMIRSGASMDHVLTGLT